MDLNPSSGTIRVKQGHNPEINMHIKSMKDGEDANYELLTDFSCGKDEVKTDIPLLSTVAGRHSAEPVLEKDCMIAKGDVWSMYTAKLPGGGKLEIEAISVKKSGLAGTDDEVVYLYPDDFKYNVKLEWPDLPQQETESFVYLQIEYEIENGTVIKAKDDGSVYLVDGSNLILRVPNKYYVFDETSSTMQERTMEDGYPKLSTSPDDENVKLFTFQFAKAKQIFYDPNHTELPLYTRIFVQKKKFREKGWRLKISAKVVADWLQAILAGTVGLAALFGSNATNIDVSSIDVFLKEDSWRKTVVDGGDGGATFIAITSSITHKELRVVGFQRSKKAVACAVYHIQSRNPAGKCHLILLENGLHYLNVDQFFEKRDMNAKCNDPRLQKAMETELQEEFLRNVIQNPSGTLQRVIEPRERGDGRLKAAVAVIVCLLVILIIVLIYYHSNNVKPNDGLFRAVFRALRVEL